MHAIAGTALVACLLIGGCGHSPRDPKAAGGAAAHGASVAGSGHDSATAQGASVNASSKGGAPAMPAAASMAAGSSSAAPLDAGEGTAPRSNVASAQPVARDAGANADAGGETAAGASAAGCSDPSCRAGTRCCAVCGLNTCVAVALACPQLECGNCGAQDARASGDCTSPLGMVWDGTRCVRLVGCACEGADCGELLPVGPDCAARMQARGCLPLDCRTTGCPNAEHCQQCWSSWVCAPAGGGSAC